MILTRSIFSGMEPLLLLKEKSEVVPVFFGGLGSYVSDGSGAHEEGKEFHGVRVFHKYDRHGRLRVEGHKASVFRDYDKGLLVPFSQSGNPEYAFIAKAQDIPRD